MAADIPDTAPAAAGTTQLRRHRSGQRLTRGQAILAKCSDCMGYWVDGRQDCRLPSCPLYPFSPYRSGQ